MTDNVVFKNLNRKIDEVVFSWKGLGYGIISRQNIREGAPPSAKAYYTIDGRRHESYGEAVDHHLERRARIESKRDTVEKHASAQRRLKSRL